MSLNKIIKYITLYLTLLVVVFLSESLMGGKGVHSVGGNEKERSLNIPEKVPVSWKIRNISSEFSGGEILDAQITQLMNQLKINGAAVAVAMEGRLVYSKGLGLANLTTGEEVTPGHLFRIASVSKLITAVAIMKLVEEGKLDLSSTVFGPDGVLNDSIYLNFRDKRFTKVTIRQLLYHTSGLGRRYGDPVFNTLHVAKTLHKDPLLSSTDVIQFALNFPLSYNPGTRYSYSNLGYIILGEVISKVSGLKYENYVKKYILAPLDIYDMHIGKPFPEQHFWNEVQYYEPPRYSYCLAIDGSGRSVQRCNGGIDVSLLGAAGGWIASGPELMKFLLSVDGYPEVPDIISEQSISTMLTPSYPLNSLMGWRGKDDEDNWWRTGTMAGTVAHVMRRNDNTSWLVLFNGSSWRRGNVHAQIVNTMNTAIDSVKIWPSWDLLDQSPIQPMIPIAAESIR